MIYTDATKKAMQLCYAAHRDQTDKSGIPYVFHPIHLAEQMKDEDTTIVALLHDVVEDSSYTFEDIKALGFGDRIIAALKLLTHEKGTPYMAYIEKIKEDPIARTVKLADLAHNSDLSRLDTVDEQARSRIRRYSKAINVLKDMECITQEKLCSDPIEEDRVIFSSRWPGHDMDALEKLLVQKKLLNERIYEQCKVLVDAVLNGSITDEQEVKRILNVITYQCDGERYLSLSRDLCRYIFEYFPQMTASSPNMFRMMFE